MMLRPLDKQIVKSWYQHLAEPHIAKLSGRVLRTTGPRIAVVGNCQSYSTAYAMKLMLPAARVDHFPIISGARLSIRVLAETLATYDFIFAHDFPSGFIPGGGLAELRQRLPRIAFLPQIAFSAFHPDCIYVGENAAAPQVFSPLGAYHSALAVFAFRAGLSIEEANALFNDNVFAALGYYNFWNDACRELIAINKESFDFDLSAELSSWGRRGVFMYTINHPKPFVMIDVAKALLSRAGLQIQDIDTDYYMIDDFIDLNQPIFPIYPPIGAHYGVKGSYTFRLTSRHLVRNLSDYLTLPQFIFSCYKKYKECVPAVLGNPRVDAWLADCGVRDQIVSLARSNLAAGLAPVR
ncbi:MAG TPA: WcbI family polysaccharide biosynthesis putative acetyltransferase [Methylocystis sp.]|nr:WcbI family polysaccharide biosynthesis putative acetyltransferase [Methylocystis sp.]